MKNLNEKRPSGLALLPFAMFIVIYMGAGIYYQVKGMEMAFYQFPSVTAMFLAVLAAFIMFKGTINEKFDTILMLMNGIGIVGTISQLPKFFDHIAEIMEPNG